MINKERLKEIKDLKLFQGSGPSIDHACVMQMVSYVANEPWTDSPACACPVLTKFAIRINDRMDDEHRQLLKPLIPNLVGTRDEKLAVKRVQYFAHQAGSVFLPLLTEGLGLVEITQTLRAFKRDELKKAAEYIQEQRLAIRRAGDAEGVAAAEALAEAVVAVSAVAEAVAEAAIYAVAEAVAAVCAVAEGVGDAAIYAVTCADRKKWIQIRNAIWASQVKALWNATCLAEFM